MFLKDITKCGLPESREAAGIFAEMCRRLGRPSRASGSCGHFLQKCVAAWGGLPVLQGAAGIFCKNVLPLGEAFPCFGKLRELFEKMCRRLG